MKTTNIPFNIKLLSPTPERLKLLRPTTTGDIYDGNTNNFNEDGLFSTLTYGAMGDDRRNTQFSYIDLHTKILHPVVYKELSKLKGLYRDILSGKSTAVWNAKLKDFERANEVDGETGYAFFMSHWDELVFTKNDSDQRTLRVDLINKYRAEAQVSYMLVIPAGLRDIEVDKTGRVTENEINGLYRKVLAISNTIQASDGRSNSEVYNTSRWSLQIAFVEIYETLRQMLEGKKGFIQQKWGSRRIFNGTRNVISGMDPSAVRSTDDNMPGANDTMIGLFQTMKGALPVTQHLLSTGLASEIFTEDAASTLINIKTGKPEQVAVPAKERDLWTTIEGITKLINRFTTTSKRHTPIIVAGHYMARIYRNPNNHTFRVILPNEELPEWVDLDMVKPLTWGEYFYTETYIKLDTLKAVITRYPILGLGSTYPSDVFLRTTIKGELMRPLGVDWELDPSKMSAREMPTIGSAWVESVALSGYRLIGLGADFDGDTVSVNIVYSKEAVAEITAYLNSKAAYIDPRGGLHQAPTDTLELMMTNMLT